jgi:hypothetical protein
MEGGLGPFVTDGTRFCGICWPPPGVAPDERIDMRVFIRAVAITVMALLASMFTATAFGAQPIVIELEPSDNVFVVTDLCAFPVTITGHTEGTLRFYNFADGSQLLIVQITETDTFSANGNTLTGLPYPARNKIAFDAEGNVTSEFIPGMLERLRLPDGSLFISAGRYEPSTTEPGFTILPSVGHFGDVDALCAALAA